MNIQEDTLHARIWNAKHEDKDNSFTEEQLDELVKLIGSGCRQDTKDRLYRRLSMLSLMPNYGIYNRVDILPIGYCAGQSYPDEIRTVRQLILKG